MPPKKRAKTKSWQDIAKQAQNDRTASLPESLVRICLPPIPNLPPSQQRTRCLPSPTVSITSLSPSAIVAAITSPSQPTMTASQVVTSFTLAAVLAHKTTNCLAELVYTDRAKSRAEALDATFTATGHPVGLLHGVPVSIKSHIGVKGRRMPSGYVAWYDDASDEHVAPDDALVVKILERAGAVVHARTAEPQGMMQLETVSNLFGTTTHPYSEVLSPGGSSGGEAALLAMGGSCIGVGSDIGGSIRVPAAACGLFGLKPTAFRVPTTGWAGTPPGGDGIVTVLGPMCASLEGVELFMRVVLDAEPWLVEPALVPMPWREVKLPPRIRIGVAWDDGIVLPHPPVTRTLGDLVARISGLPGIEVVDFPLYKPDEAWAIASSLYLTDGGASEQAILAASGEPPTPLMQWILDNPGVKDLSRSELEYWLEEREEFRIEYAGHWNRTGEWSDVAGRWEGTVDVLICPVAPWVAMRHGTAKYWGYSALWNLLDYPALAFPAGRADGEVDVKGVRKTFMSDHDRENWELCKWSFLYRGLCTNRVG
ncbi:acetamidase [Echria macrotheca]|uniref:amidase n=1 Tax=Echria macrotheca TaxID=438768 RepID=A0AAJ0B3G1_9PEZI|nr:acetamidase [Echria macrotheca]